MLVGKLEMKTICRIQFYFGILGFCFASFFLYESCLGAEIPIKKPFTNFLTKASIVKGISVPKTQKFLQELQRGTCFESSGVIFAFAAVKIPQDAFANKMENLLRVRARLFCLRAVMITEIKQELERHGMRRSNLLVSSIEIALSEENDLKGRIERKIESFIGSESGWVFSIVKVNRDEVSIELRSEEFIHSVSLIYGEILLHKIESKEIKFTSNHLSEFEELPSLKNNTILGLGKILVQQNRLSSMDLAWLKKKLLEIPSPSGDFCEEIGDFYGENNLDLEAEYWYKKALDKNRNESGFHLINN